MRAAFLAICSSLVISGSLAAAETTASREAQFLGWSRFADFQGETNGGRMILTSPTVKPSILWNELILSWNTQGDATNGFSFEAQVIYPDHQTRWYELGDWALDAAVYARRSVKGQRDDDGNVATDTLQMRRAGGDIRVRVSLPLAKTGALRFIGLSLCDTSVIPPHLNARTNVWGKVLDIPEKSQADYPEGISAWCSPTAVSMILGYWARELHRPDLEHSVPETARGVTDPNWPGTGNWPFNTGFAGAHPGMRAYVTRLSDVSELEAWIETGVPVALSVSYGLLKGDMKPGNGHLVVCSGFTESGDLVANDPGRRKVRQIYRREDLVRAWHASHNTVYLIYPERNAVPQDTFGHWFTP